MHGCGRWFNAVRDTVTRPLPRRLSSTGEAAGQGRRERSLQAGAGRPDRSGAGRCASRFDGRSYQGFAGDTLASALLANGVHLVGRSFKYHRPRGIMTAGAEEPNALVQLERPGGRSDPNLRATEIELYDGLDGREPEPLAQSAGFDVGAAADLLSPLLPAGFYYKTFLWPAALVALGLRAAASAAPPASAAAPTRPDPDRYLHRHAHCDVLVVGAGPAGPDGGARRRPQRRPGDPGRARGRARRLRCWARAAVAGQFDGRRGAGSRQVQAELAALPEVTVLRRTTAFGYLRPQLSGPARAGRRPPAAPRPRASRGSASGGCGRGRSCSRPAPSSGRWSSAATTGPA